MTGAKQTQKSHQLLLVFKNCNTEKKLEHSDTAPNRLINYICSLTSQLPLWA